MVKQDINVSGVCNAGGVPGRDVFSSGANPKAPVLLFLPKKLGSTLVKSVVRE
jgi:hypothetical protein